MNVCIVTVHNSSNCGSFLQATALKTILEKEGNNVFFLHRDVHQGIKYCIITSIKKACKLKLNQIAGVWKEYRAFADANRIFTQIKAEDCGNIDCFIIGSDTVWNFDEIYFAQNKHRYLGLEFCGKRTVSYAASIANTSYNTLTDDKVIVNGLNNLNAVSVRDYYTKKIVDRITGKQSVLVLDPTLLLSREEFAGLETECFGEGHILIYMFGKISNDTKSKLIEIRKNTGKKIVSFGGYRDFADINVSNDPFKFLYYFNHADMVITNTFHGTIFSILNRKPFAEFGGHKKKVSELLSMLDLREQICENAEDMEKILNQKIDYDKVDKKLDVLRKQSKEYLLNALKG